MRIRFRQVICGECEYFQSKRCIIDDAKTDHLEKCNKTVNDVDRYDTKKNNKVGGTR